MIQQLSDNLTSFFVDKSLISIEEKHIYAYCFEVFLSTILSWGSVVALAVVTNTVFPTVCYMLCFFFFRGVAGGYHATTHLNCYILSMLTFLLFLIGQAILPQQSYLMISSFFIICSTFIILFLAPVEHKNNPFTERTRKQFRTKSLMVLFFFLLIVFILFRFQLIKVIFYIAWGCFQAAISVAVAFYLNKRRMKNEKSIC